MELEFGEVNPALQQMMEQLRKAADNIPKTQERMRSLTGEAWSDDGMVKAVVGPRGQLVDLEIDPRLFRQSDSGALRAQILSAASAAARDVSDKARDAMYEMMPPDIAEVRARYLPKWEDTAPDVFRPDAELYAERQAER